MILINLSIHISILLFAIISTIHYFPKTDEREIKNIKQLDERDIMFARDNLRFYPKLYTNYYSNNPEKEIIDKPIHNKGNLTDSSKLYYDKYYTPLYDTAFDFLDLQRKLFSVKINKEKTKTDKEKIIKTIKNICKIYGAVDVGFTKLKPYHFYSHKGRQAEGWGKEIINNHKWGIAIIVPMSIDMIKKAPTISTIVESSKAYVEAVKIAYILEIYIKKLGYDAKSHSDGNYDTLCVPIAVDAKLGELSRMGLIIHKDYGPSVRISIVTTNLELEQTKRKSQNIESFCKICKKCSDNCPSGAIESGYEPITRGIKHWSVNQEKCFSFWKNIGTDCGFCLKVCPLQNPIIYSIKLSGFISREIP
jgi:ferredoxin